MKNVAIFMSSTFNDMQSERDLIRERVTPEIAETLSVYGRSVEFIDLRWGIDTASVDENVANRKILRTCFEEIKNSDPFFVAFLGERYGWIPDYSDVISALENEGIPTDGDIAGKSVTELEIECAARLNPIMDKTVFYFRDDVDYGADREHADMFVSRGEEREKLNALKARLAKKYPDRVRTYRATWNAEQKRIEGLEDLERQVITDVKNIIVNDASVVRALDPKEESVNVIDGTVAALASSFSGRVAERKQILEFVRGDGRMLVLSGQSGSGKSALLAKAATECEEENVTVLPFFVGADERCGTAESMMTLTAFRATKALGLDENVELSGEKLAQKFAFLLNRLALDRPVVLIVDAINQFAPTEYENKLKWLNLYALSPRVKVIMSATSDYYGLSFLRALGAKIQNLDYFSESDVRAVSERYFTVNHKQASEKLLSAIAQKDGGASPCRQPIYLLSLLQQLNNLGREDFAKIKDREKTAGESAADAIVNYLVDTVVTAPSELGNQLDRLLDAACEKAGEVCRLFVNAIALSRRGITERLMESVCKALNAEFDGATFSYFRRMFKTNLVRRENGAWDFSHALVKSHYSSRVNEAAAKAIIGAVIESLKAEPDDSLFKRTEYAFYLTAADRLDLFVPFLAGGDEITRQSLTYELREKRNADKAQKLFDLSQHAQTVRRFVVDTVSAGAYSPELAERYCYYALKAIYEDGEYNADNATLSAVCDIYRAVGAVGMSAGYYRLAKDYLLLAKRTAEKTGGAKADIMSKLSECYYALGAGLKSSRYGKLAVKALEDEYACGEMPAARLLDAYVSECERNLRAVIVRRKKITALIDKCRTLLAAIDDESEKRKYAAKLLLCAADVNINGLDDLVELADGGDSDEDKAFIEYALGAYMLNTSVDEAMMRLNEAHEVATDKLKHDVNVDVLKLSDKICELKIIAMRIKGEDCAELICERADYLNRIILLEPSYYAANEYLSVATEKTDARDNAERVRKKLSRGVSTAEHKAVNKILIAILLGTIAVFTIGMPLVFSVLRGLVQQSFSASPFTIFTDFYAQSLFEAFFNVFFLFGVYGLMQIIKPTSDYVIKRVWIKRTTALWVLAAAVVVAYAVVWNYFKSMLLKGFAYDFLTYEIPYLFLLVSELLVLVLLANEIVKFIMHELPARSTADNYKRFVCGYKRAMLGYAVDGAALVVDILGAYLLFGWYKSVGHGSLLLLGQTVFYAFAILTAVIVAVKLVYLTVMFFVVRKRYGKNTAN